MEVASSIESDTSEKSSQNPAKVFQSEETSLLQPTGTTSIEVETTAQTGSVYN